MDGWMDGHGTRVYEIADVPLQPELDADEAKARARVADRVRQSDPSALVQSAPGSAVPEAEIPGVRTAGIGEAYGIGRLPRDVRQTYCGVAFEVCWHSSSGHRSQATVWHSLSRAVGVRSILPRA